MKQHCNVCVVCRCHGGGPYHKAYFHFACALRSGWSPPPPPTCLQRCSGSCFFCPSHRNKVSVPSRTIPQPGPSLAQSFCQDQNAKLSPSSAVCTRRRRELEPKEPSGGSRPVLTEETAAPKLAAAKPSKTFRRYTCPVCSMPARQQQRHAACVLSRSPMSVGVDCIILAHVAIVVSKVANNAINEHLDVCLGITAPSRQISEKGTGNSVSSSSADRAHGSAMDDSTAQDDTPCDACLLVASERPVECNILSVGCPTPSCRGPLVSLHATAPRTRNKH